MKKLTSLCLLMSVIACGGNSSGDGAKAGPSAETDRYYKALDTTFAGDARGGYDAMLQLAVDEPDSRAGRKARAVLQSDDPLVYVAMAGALSAIAIPNFQKFSKKAKESGGKLNAKMAYIAQRSYFAEHDRYCKNAKECLLSVDDPNYVIVLGPKEVIRPATMDKATADALALRAHGALIPLGIKAGVVPKKSFMAVVVGNIDDDEDVDIWTIDQDNQMNHVLDDME